MILEYVVRDNYLFLQSKYFNEKNIINHPEAVAKALQVTPDFLASYLKDLDEELKPDWLKEKYMSDELKLFLEIKGMEEPRNPTFIEADKDEVYERKISSKSYKKRLKKQMELEKND